MTAPHLDFERPIVEKEREIAELRAASNVPEEERARRLAQLEADRDRLRRTIFSELSPIQRVQLARHPRRPYLLDYVALAFEDWIELHGDRAFAEDRALVGGLARLDGRSLVLIGHQKGRDTKENLRRNFGMPHPEGYRKALRLMKLAEKFGLPVVTLIDTPGAYPGIGAEERGQAEAIARNLREMAALRVPLLSVVTGEGASGGALGIGVTDRILMLENAFYSVISPEGCAAILWNNGEMRAEAARAMKVTAGDLLELGVIEEILPEPPGGAHNDWPGAASVVAAAIRRHLRELSAKDADTLVAERGLKYRRIGQWQEGPGSAVTGRTAEASAAAGAAGAPGSSNAASAPASPKGSGSPELAGPPNAAGAPPSPKAPGAPELPGPPNAAGAPPSPRPAESPGPPNTTGAPESPKATGSAGSPSTPSATGAASPAGAASATTAATAPNAGGAGGATAAAGSHLRGR